jgi:hypothetical protein
MLSAWFRAGNPHEGAMHLFIKAGWLRFHMPENARYMEAIL